VFVNTNVTDDDGVPADFDAFRTAIDIYLV
jgi:hypothetical protein